MTNYNNFGSYLRRITNNSGKKYGKIYKESEKNLSAQISDVYDLIGNPIIPKLDKHDEQLTQHDTDIAELQKAVGLKPRHQ
jgi:hypothetical protein